MGWSGCVECVGHDLGRGGFLFRRTPPLTHAPPPPPHLGGGGVAVHAEAAPPFPLSHMPPLPPFPPLPQAVAVLQCMQRLASSHDMAGRRSTGEGRGRVH